jgi:transposase-like protein
VIKWEKRVVLVHYLEQGLSVSAIARELGVDRRTIHRWKAAGELGSSAEFSVESIFWCLMVTRPA